MKNKKEQELINIGKACFERGEYKKARMIFSEVLESDGQSIDAYFYLANIFHMNGELGKAIKAFNKVLEIEPNHTDAAVSLSVLYNDIGEYTKAQKIFAAANERVKSNSKEVGVTDIHINKKFSSKHHELAELYLSYSRYDEALFEFKKSIDLNPENLDARIKISKVYAKKGFSSKAFDELRKLKNERPNFIEGRIALGILHFGNGNILEAQSEWEKVLSFDPKNKEASMYLDLSRTATETTV